MTFVLDADVPEAIARVIAQAGHSAERLRDILPADANDSSILQYAQTTRAVLITCNRDHFLALARTRPHAGIIILIRRRSRVEECSRFLRLLRQAGESGLSNNINFA